MKITNLGIMAFSSVAMVLSGAPALALGLVNQHASAQAGTGDSSQAVDRVETGKAKLADAKLKACQNRQKAINNIMARIAARGQKQVDLFSTIATRTETFYTNKGKTLSNYDTLVSDVTAKKEAAQTAVDAVKSDSVSFSCDGADPKVMATIFKDNLKLENNALKEYKTSVKNLIVGVKSVQGSTTSTEKSTTGGNQ